MSRGHKRCHLKSEKIIFVAMSVFAKNGYAGTTLLSIAQEFGVTDKALYYYFPGKDAIYLATLNHCAEQVDSLIETVDGKQIGGLNKIKSFACALLRQPACLELYFRRLPGHLLDREQAVQFSGTVRTHKARLVGWIRDGITDGSILSADPDLLWEWARSALVGFGAGFRKDENRRAAQLEQEVLAMLDRSLVAAGGMEIEKERAALLRERAHWVKNTLAVVQGLALQTAVASRSLEEFEELFQGRLAALARGREHFLRGEQDSVELRRLVEKGLSAFKSGRIHACGPSVHVSSKAAMSLNMVLYELETNSERHGALSREDGRIDIVWSGGDGGEVQLVWQESGGPPIRAPQREEFGMTLIRQLTEYELGGTAELLFRPDGFRTELTFLPLVGGKLKAEGGVEEHGSGYPSEGLSHRRG